MTDGIPVSGFELAGWLPGIFAVIAAAGVLIGAFQMKDGLRRNFIYTAAGTLCFWLTAVLLVQAGRMLPSGASPRVSPAIGFWGLPAASYVLIDHSRRTSSSGRRILRGLILPAVLLLPAVVILAGGRGESISVFREWTVRRSRFLDELLMHIRLFGTAVISAAVLGIPLGILVFRNKRTGAWLSAFVDGMQTVPSMALFGLLMAPLAALSRAFPLLRSLGLRGIGTPPALIALTLYALLPIVRNTAAGLASVPSFALEAGRGLGMSSLQLFSRVQWPMALPHVLSGIRTSSVQAVGNTAVAALIGAGGLGVMVFQGLGQAAPDLVLLGVIPLILMAVAVDRIWGLVISLRVSPGLQMKGASS